MKNVYDKRMRFSSGASQVERGQRSISNYKERLRQVYHDPSTKHCSLEKKDYESEELPYGPGFVSRVKNRYLSVALRGTSSTGTRKRPSLRRTASFEEVAAKEAEPKTEAEKENCKEQESRLKVKNEGPPDPFQRSTSVEVLSVPLHPLTPRPQKAVRPLENVLNTLANHRIQLTDLTSARINLPARRSSGLLFGVETKDLPRADMVKETLRFFEKGIQKPNSDAKDRKECLTSIEERRELVSKPAETRRGLGIQTTKSPNNPNTDRGIEITLQPITIIKQTPAKTLPNQSTTFGQRIIGETALRNIRQSGLTFSYDFGSNPKPSSTFPNFSTPTTPRQVGVIKPLTRNPDDQQQPSMRAFQQERKANEVCDKTLPALDLTNSTKPVNNQLISDLCIEDMSIETEGSKATMMSGPTSALSRTRNSIKSRRESQPTTMVFNFVNSNKVVTHIENDGLDMSKRTSKKDFPNQENDDLDVGRPVSPCTVRFVGENVLVGKSSFKSKNTKKKMSITFCPMQPEVFEYPSDECNNNYSEQHEQSGLRNFTPSKLNVLDPCFELGVNRLPNLTASKSLESKTTATIIPMAVTVRGLEDKWSGTTADLLF